MEVWAAAGTVLLGLILLGLLAVLYLVVKQQGRLLLRLDEIQRRLDELSQRGAASAPSAAATAVRAIPRGIPVGEPIPAFSLPDLDGRNVAVEDFRGSRTLLVHWAPGCGFCERIAPELAELQSELEWRGIRLGLVSHGDATSNRALADKHALRCPILLHGERETIPAFRTFGTPVAYLIDETGRVAAPIAIGADHVSALARQVAAGAAAGRDARAAPTETHAGNGAGPRAGLRGERPLTESRIERSGLKAGTTAPAFSLPDLDGSLVTLDGYRGRRVLVVFSDPHCGPCNQLGPQLGRLHRQHRDDGLAFVLVGRGDADENRRKAAEHGIEFPVVLQRRWEVSKAYGIFATPVAFLVGADGVIERDVATGTDAIVRLAGETLAAGVVGER